MTEQYMLAYGLLEREKLLTRYSEGSLLAARCLLKSGDADGALELIGEDDEENCQWMDEKSAEKTVALSSRTAALRGAIFEAVENRSQAAHWYLEAMRRDVMNYEAFLAMDEKYLLTSEQEEELSQSIRSSRALSEGMLWEIYGCKLNIYGIDGENGILEIPVDLDLMAARAKALYYNCQTEKSLQVCKKIFNVHSSHLSLLTVYLACLVDLGEKNELFYLSHQLVEHKPGSAVSWYAIGCYYLLTGKFDYARHYFRRCTAADSSFGEGWMGFAHAFALQGEHDQAMAAYRTSARMISNCHLPSLCIAMEYLRVNNLGLALKFVENAKLLAPKDPLIYNEMGVIHYRNESYGEALACFRQVFALVGETGMRKRVEWEATLFNVGHVLRKMGNYVEALKHFFMCLSLKPHNASTLSAIGLTYHFSGVIDKAIEYYHLALSKKADDAFTNDMLKRALEEDFRI